jgi:hypothetical protein
MSEEPWSSVAALEGAWDNSLAEDLIGATLLVGLTYLNHDGSLRSRRQFFGRVRTCTLEKGIVVEDEETGEILNLPPLQEAIEHAGPGRYQMRESDRVVDDPDFTALFTVTAAPRQ